MYLESEGQFSSPRWIHSEFVGTSSFLLSPTIVSRNAISGVSKTNEYSGPDEKSTMMLVPLLTLRLMISCHVPAVPRDRSDRHLSILLCLFNIIIVVCSIVKCLSNSSL
ncbi:hypothetical protein DPSP01_006197 [Paraphaeosphaeria sporulosa]